jgi:hypothetical protein
MSKKIPLYDFENSALPPTSKKSRRPDDEHDVVYTVTPKGILYMSVGPEVSDLAIKALAEHMKKFYSEKGYPAMILENGQLHFVTITKG